MASSMDMSKMKDELLIISTTSSSTKPSETESFPPVKVLLWNIHGDTRKSKQSDAAGAEEIPDKLREQSASGCRGCRSASSSVRIHPPLMLQMQRSCSLDCGICI